MNYLPVIAIVISAITLVIAIVNQRVNQSRWQTEQAESFRRWQAEQLAKQAIADRIQDDKITRLQTQMELFWNSISGNIGTLLKSPHTPERDLLIYKFQHQELTLPEAELLRSIFVDEKEIIGRNNGILGLLLPIAVLDAKIYGMKWDREHQNVNIG